MSGEVLPLIGVGGLDDIGDWMGEYEGGSDVGFPVVLLDTTDERCEIDGEEGWDIGGEGGFAECVIAGKSLKKSWSESELDGSGEGAEKKSWEVS